MSVSRKPRNGRIPAGVRATLWSHDTRKLDIWRDREIVITQVLNYGNWKAVRWVLKTYGRAEVRRLVASPGRGRWWPQVLNFWVTVLDVRLAAATFERAIIRMKPD